MSVADTSTYFPGDDLAARKRWGGSFAAVLALHLGVGLSAMTWAVPLAAPEAALPPAVLIDMLPTPPAPPKPAEIVKPDVKPDVLPIIKKAEVVIQKPKPKPKPKVEKRKEPEPVKTLDNRPEAAAPKKAESTTEARPGVPPTYLSELLAHIYRYKRYPASARRLHKEGTVYVWFTIDRTGHVLSSRIDRSSGVDTLDEASLAMLGRADPVPPIPKDMDRDRMEIIVPVVFDLKK
ncbi:MAG TPA: energy transducer TonB [Parvibaculum sp.]|jgi:protein TonB